jgi:hypothetical protein
MSLGTGNRLVIAVDERFSGVRRWLAINCGVGITSSIVSYNLVLLLSREFEIGQNFETFWLGKGTS